MTLDEIKLIINERHPRMEGWVSAERAIEMAELIIKAQPEVCVELGVFGGKSMLGEGLGLKANNHGKLYAVDPWKKEAATEGATDPRNDEWWAALDLHHIHRQCMEEIWRHGLDEFVTVIRAKSEHVSELFPVIDWLFIDGNHSELCSCRDVNNYVPKVTKHGYVLMDDCKWPSTQKALKLVEDCCDLEKKAESGGTEYRIYRKR